MNILHLTKNYTKLNGITTFIENLVNTDSPNNHYIISNFIEENYFKKKLNLYIPKSSNLSLLSFFRSTYLMINLCNKKKIDVIHSHHRYFDLLAYFISKFIGIKTVTTVHSKVYGRKIFSYKANKLVAVSESIKSHLMEYFGIEEKRITVINNFIDPKSISITCDAKEIRKELQIDESKFVIGFAGRFNIKEKGIDILLKASTDIIYKYKNVIFVLIGNGEDKDYLLKKSRNLAENLRMVETKNDIYNYIQIFNVFVLPSRIDPFPLVMLEAAYLKIPFIGSNVDGIGEFVNDKIDGLLFESENEKELSNRINTLINNPNLCIKYAENLHKKVREKFTADVVIPQYDNLYQALLNSSNGTN